MSSLWHVVVALVCLLCLLCAIHAQGDYPRLQRRGTVYVTVTEYRYIPVAPTNVAVARRPGKQDVQPDRAVIARPTATNAPAAAATTLQSQQRPSPFDYHHTMATTKLNTVNSDQLRTSWPSWMDVLLDTYGTSADPVPLAPPSSHSASLYFQSSRPPSPPLYPAMYHPDAISSVPYPAPVLIPPASPTIVSQPFNPPSLLANVDRISILPSPSAARTSPPLNVAANVASLKSMTSDAQFAPISNVAPLSSSISINLDVAAGPVPIAPHAFPVMNINPTLAAPVALRSSLPLVASSMMPPPPSYATVAAAMPQPLTSLVPSHAPRPLVPTDAFIAVPPAATRIDAVVPPPGIPTAASLPQQSPRRPPSWENALTFTSYPGLNAPLAPPTVAPSPAIPSHQPPIMELPHAYATNPLSIPEEAPHRAATRPQDPHINPLPAAFPLPPARELENTAIPRPSGTWYPAPSPAASPTKVHAPVITSTGKEGKVTTTTRDPATAAIVTGSQPSPTTTPHVSNKDKEEDLGEDDDETKTHRSSSKEDKSKAITDEVTVSVTSTTRGLATTTSTSTFVGTDLTTTVMTLVPSATTRPISRPTSGASPISARLCHRSRPKDDKALRGVLTWCARRVSPFVISNQIAVGMTLLSTIGGLFTVAM